MLRNVLRHALLATAAAAVIAPANVAAFAPPLASSSATAQLQRLSAQSQRRLVNDATKTTTTTTTMARALTTTLRKMSSDDDGWASAKGSAMIGGAGVSNAGEPPFEIRGFSLGNLVVSLGLLITVASFVEYLTNDGGEGLTVSGLGFVYGIPVFLAGAALKYAEIDPVPVRTTEQAESVFEQKATETIRKIKQDVTRHRYGDEAHLDTTVKKLGLVVPGKAYPQLMELRQGISDNGELQFMMVWQSVDTPYKMWADERRIKKYETFFGPDVTAEVVKIDAEQRLVGIQLTTMVSTPAPLPTL